MADVIKCYNFMMDNEDFLRKYAIVPDSPKGSYAISGVNSASFPFAYAGIEAIPQDHRGPAIQHFYENTFWNNWLEQLTSDDLAMRVFDSSVNMGSHIAVTLLQRTINSLIPNALIEDGIWGPNTLDYANKICEPNLFSNAVNEFKNMRVAYYQDIVKKNPDDAKYLNTWLTRARK